MKTALVTGASSKIGLAVCALLTQQGFRLVCQYTSNHKEGFFQGKGRECASVRVDFSHQQALEEFVSFVEKHTDSIDAIVHCAAKHEKMVSAATDEAIFDAVTHVNLFAPIFIIKKLARKMKTADNPAIVFISSAYATQLGTLNNLYYAATKTALHTVSRIVAREFAPIRSNIIMPGYVDTPSYRLGREEADIHQDRQAALGKTLVSPQEIAEAVLFILNNRSVNGSVITVDGGLRL